MAQFVVPAMGVPAACLAVGGVFSRIKKRRRAYKHNAIDLDNAIARLGGVHSLFRNIQGRTSADDDAHELVICARKLERQERLHGELVQLREVERGRGRLTRFCKAISVKKSIESALTEVREDEQVGFYTSALVENRRLQAEQLEYSRRMLAELSRIVERLGDTEIHAGSQGLERRRGVAAGRLVVTWIGRRKVLWGFFLLRSPATKLPRHIVV